MQMETDSLMSDRIGPESKVYRNVWGLPIYLTFSVAFVLASGLIATMFVDTRNISVMMMVAACASGFMALRVAANGVVSHVGSVFGRSNLSIPVVLLVAIASTATGAMLAGESVVITVSREIVSAKNAGAGNSYVLIMMTALITASFWTCIVRRQSVRLSTTYAILGALIGATVASAGLASVNWIVMLEVILGWLVTPLLAGIMAGLGLMLVEKLIYRQHDRVKAARHWIPLMPALIIALFSVYLLKFGAIEWGIEIYELYIIFIPILLGVVYIHNSQVSRILHGLSNRRREIDRLFGLPLVVAMSLLAFAHGANDVANAIGPLLSIYNALVTESYSSTPLVPLWIILIGVCGIATGTLLYGLKLARESSEEPVTLDRSSLFCVCLSAASIVMVSSSMGYPVSSTHIALGALLGVGFYREIKHLRKMILIRRAQHRAIDFRRSVFGRKNGGIIRPKKLVCLSLPVYGQSFLSSISPCLITLPATAMISAGLYLLIDYLPGS